MKDVMVWTMGKVGTGSYVRVLEDAGIDFIDTHWVTGDLPKAEFPNRSSHKQEYLDNFVAGKILPSKIIMGVREPVARSLSAFVIRLFGYGEQSYQEVYDQLISEYNVKYPDEWFVHVKEVIGFDPYAYAFDHEQGYSIYEHDKCQIAIIRIEDADVVFPEVSQILFGKNLSMVKVNQSAEHMKGDPYHSHYEYLLEQKFPKEFLDRCYGLKYAQHFYTEQELLNYRSKWE